MSSGVRIELLRSAKILDKDEKLAGVAVFMTEALLVTCAHVVNVALGRASKSRQMPGDEDKVILQCFEKDSESNHSIEGHIVEWSPPPDVDCDGSVQCNDLALISVSGLELTHVISKAKLINSPDLDDTPVSCFGFSLAHVNGASYRGVITASDTRGQYTVVKVDDHGTRVQGSEASKEFITKGFSGSFVYNETGILGIVQAGVSAHQKAIIIPVSKIEKTFSSLASHIIPALYGTYPHTRNIKEYYVDKHRSGTYFDLRIKLFGEFNELTSFLTSPTAVNYSSDCFTPQQTILNLLETNPRIIVQAHGGAGKSTFLGELIELSIKRGVVPFVLDISTGPEKFEIYEKDGVKQHSYSLFKDFSTYGDFAAFKAAIKTEGLDKVFVIVESLNERADQVSLILDSIQRFVNNDYSGIKIIIADRLSEKHQLNNFSLASIPPLTKSIIQQVLELPHSSWMGDEWFKLLSNPFFLNLYMCINDRRTYGPGSPNLVTNRTEMLKKYFYDYIKLSKDELHLLGEIAYKLYGIEKSTGFPKSAFIEQLSRVKLSEKVFQTLETENVISKKSNDEDCEFRHQLLQDFLVGLYIANLDCRQWRAPLFDIASLNGASSDCLEFATVLSAGGSDKFLTEVYDWNYNVTIDCVINFEQFYAGSATPLPSQFTDAIFAIHAEKAFDTFQHTSNKIKTKSQFFKSPAGIDYSSIRDLDHLRSEINQKYLVSANEKGEYYATWKKIFLLDAPAELSDLKYLWMDALTGWTASNVFKRKPVTEQVMQELHKYYGIILQTGEDHPRAASARWRIAHTLGNNCSEGNFNFLRKIVFDNNENHWVRYGAIRSFVEATSLHELRELRDNNIGYLKNNIAKLTPFPILLAEVRRTAVLSNARVPDGWEAAYAELVACGIAEINEDEMPEEHKHWVSLHGKLQS